MNVVMITIAVFFKIEAISSDNRIKSEENFEIEHHANNIKVLRTAELI